MNAIATIRQGARLLYLYPDGTMLPIMAGGDDRGSGPSPAGLSSAAHEAWHRVNDTAEDAPDLASVPAQSYAYQELFGANDEPMGYIVPIYNPRNNSYKYVWSTTGKTFVPGIYTTSSGTLVTLNSEGRSISTRQIPWSQLTGSGATGRDAAAQGLDSAQAAYWAQKAALEREQLAQQRQESLLNSATRLAEQRQASRESARQQRIELAGKDPFRLIAGLQARNAGTGPTPYDALKSQVAGVATQDIPMVGATSTSADLESAIAKMQSFNPEVSGVPLAGMAQGGLIAPMQPGGMMGQGMGGQGGPQFGGQGYSVMVGDAKMNGDEEIATMHPNGSVTITPLMGRAADGVVMPAGPTVLPQSYQNYGNLNLTTVPEMFQNLRASMGGRLGIASTPSTAPAQFGGAYGATYGLDSIYKGLMEAGVPDAEAQKMSSLIGQLPNPRTAANAFRYMNPAEQMVVKSAYKLAGIDEATFDDMVNSALIAGPERRALQVA